MGFSFILSCLFVVPSISLIYGDTPKNQDVTLEADEIVCERKKGKCLGKGNVKLLKKDMLQGKKTTKSQNLTADNMDVTFKMDEQSLSTKNKTDKETSFRDIEKVDVGGHVTLIEGEDGIQSEHAHLDVEKKDATFSNNVRLIKDGYFAKGEAAHYNPDKGMALKGGPEGQARAMINIERDQRSKD